MCDCIDKMNAALKPHNTRLDTLLGISPNMQLVARAQIATEKIDTDKRTPKHAVAAAFCPFCGEKFAYDSTSQRKTK